MDGWMGNVSNRMDSHARIVTIRFLVLSVRRPKR